MMTKADIRTVRLYRKTFEENDAETEKNGYFATDYFDILTAEKKDLNDSFPSILGIEDTVGGNGRGETAMQGYTLYCSVQMQETYECPSEFAEKKESMVNFGDPFEDREDLPFLSIIQVHITPEILSRMEFDEDNLWRLTNDGEYPVLLEPFISDIYKILDQFRLRDTGEKCVCRVYHVLSAGDFAVAVRSAKVETSYKISTLFRRRKAQTKKKDNSWVIYKTYTLLTMKSYIIASEAEDESSGANQFALRCCYSNKYWNEQNVVKEWQSRHQGVDKLFRMNGRYDFSIQLSEQEFQMLLPRIMKYKGIEFADSRKGPKKTRDFPVDRQTPAVEYLLFLMDKGYVSYINERYLLGNMEDGNNNDVSAIRIADGKTSQEDLKIRICAYIEKLLEKHKQVFREFDGLKSYRSSIKQYAQLLRKQIVLCGSINELSDTRIYALLLTEQLNCVLESLQFYLRLIEAEGDTFVLLNLTEEYLAEAVYALDHYAQYIRNNNLQSLQTPNYNIESSMGMEKFLIGYGEFLYTFTDGYNRLTGDTCRKLLPVVIPDLRRTATSVEVLFPEGYASSWEKERTLIGEKSRPESFRFLTVVGCPTFAHLSNIPSIFAKLFHEVAHQLRYESRKDRNDHLLKATIERCVSATVENVEAYLNHGMEGFEGQQALFHTVADAITDAVLEFYYVASEAEEDSEGPGRRYKYSYEDAPLNSFAFHLFSQLEGIATVLKNEIGWKQALETFFREILFDSIWEDSFFKEVTDIMVSGWEEILEVTSGEYLQEKIDRVQRCAFVLAGLSAYYALDEKREEVRKRAGEAGLQSKEEIMSWIKEEGEGSLHIDLLWETVFGSRSNKNFQVLYRFCLWTDNSAGLQNLLYQEKNRKKTASVFESIYRNACITWKKYEEASKGMYPGEETESNFPVNYYEIPFFSAWEKMGRYLGIDYETEENRSKFIKVMARFLTVNTEDGSNLISRYREETSDLFMCSVIPFTPFGYVNLMAESLPMQDNDNREYDDVYIERMSYVIYEKWCNAADGGASPLDRFQQECLEILKHLSDYSRPCLKFCERTEGNEIYGQLQKLLQECENVWKEKTKIRQINEKIYKISKIIEEFKRRIESGENGEGARNILDNAGRICLITVKLAEIGEFFIRNLLKESSMEKDLAYGANRLRDFSTGQEAAKNKPMVALTRLCDKIAAYFNATGEREENIRNLNEEGIEFLMRMFYKNQIRNVHGIFADEVLNDAD